MVTNRFYDCSGCYVSESKSSQIMSGNPAVFGFVFFYDASSLFGTENARKARLFHHSKVFHHNFAALCLRRNLHTSGLSFRKVDTPWFPAAGWGWLNLVKS
jgi:hypothetical protein